VIIQHKSLFVDHKKAKPVIKVYGMVQNIRKIVLIVNVPTPEEHVDQEVVVSWNDLNGLLGLLSRIIRNRPVRRMIPSQV